MLWVWLGDGQTKGTVIDAGERSIGFNCEEGVGCRRLLFFSLLAGLLKIIKK